MTELEEDILINNLKQHINSIPNFTYMFNLLLEEVNNKNKYIKQLQETITDLQQYLKPSKFKTGDIVNVYGKSDNELYVVEDFVCYDTSYALYNVHAINNKEDFETLSENDLIPTTIF